MEVTLAVISDLHCHHSSQGPAASFLLTDIDRSPPHQHPVESFLALIQKHNLKADIVLMPGDITNKIDRQGLISGWGFIQEIAIALGATSIFPTLGNHDVASRAPKDDPFQVAKRLRPQFPCLSDSLCDAFWSRGFYIQETPSVRVLAFNSVHSHLSEGLSDQGLITNQQLSEISAALEDLDPKTFQIAICHHHPILHEDIGLGKDDVMENGSLLIELLAEKGFDLLVHGHKHHPKLTYTSSSNHLAVLASGSFSAGMSGGLASRTRNVVHFVTLKEDNCGEVKGTILTWQFRQYKGWSAASFESADFPHRTGFGCHTSADAIAKSVKDRFSEAGAPVLLWESLATHLPELEFMPPGVFEAVGRSLAKYGIELTPFPPDQPKYVGMAK